ncbi:MAG: hypothetical protein DHS20C16_31290 [Phycisphaerae bacterium]|nr:MAG: hypothetical protein DHS20C16_31290 [Phycisphaerae bacterium]
MTTDRDSNELKSAAGEIREEYARRTNEGTRGTTGSAMMESRMRSYSEALSAADFIPLKQKRILDLGCANGGWLTKCCNRWGAEEHLCAGVDLREDVIRQWQIENPDSKMQIRCQSAHEIEFEDESFDLVHHSMMMSSVPDPDLSKAIANQMWRVLAPGGCIVSYDFWINPLNKKTVGVGVKQLNHWFPQARIVFRKKITFLPPLTRLLNKISQQIPVALERARIMNTHLLVVLRKDSA